MVIGADNLEGWNAADVAWASAAFRSARITAAMRSGQAAAWGAPPHSTSAATNFRNLSACWKVGLALRAGLGLDCGVRPARRASLTLLDALWDWPSFDSAAATSLLRFFGRRFAEELVHVLASTPADMNKDVPRVSGHDGRIRVQGNAATDPATRFR
jgi:hypothetical protein